VVFLEYYANNPAFNARLNRWLAAYGGGTIYLPMAMVDSGNVISNGVVVYQDKYWSMVNSSLARPPQAEVKALWMRQGNQVKFSVQVKNLSSTTLSSSNSAKVSGIVYEEGVAGALTNRYVRATAETAIPSLAKNATATYELQTADLPSGVNWNKLHFIALVDYRPGGSTGKYDMLQAAVALPPQVSPEQLVFLVDNGATTVPDQSAQVQGPSSLTWNSSESASWLTVTPTGSPSTPVVFSVSKAALLSGWQQTEVTISSPDGYFSDQVTVKTYLGDLSTIFLPMTAK
jgi:hypothetical protein